MEKDTLQNIVTGLLSLILGVLGYMLSTAYEDIRELKHELDLHKSSSEQRIDQAESELDDLWGKFNGLQEYEKETEHRITKLENG